MPQISQKRFLQIIFLVFVFIMAWGFFYFELNEKLTKENIGIVKEFMLQFGWWTPVLIIILYITFNVAGLPTLFFSILSGYLYGWYWGFALAWGGMTVGLLSSFICGRYLFREYFVKKYGNRKIVKQLERMLEKYHLWAVVFTRISFVFPYNLLNYAYSITSIRTSTYLFGSALGIFVPTLVMVYMGELLTKGVELLGIL